ncbi:MAG: hypothetical protein P1P88_06410 [Bacteroidales bacterium]|nr:hypothetical protein [Bacteroidales bacterium]
MKKINNKTRLAIGLLLLSFILLESNGYLRAQNVSRKEQLESQKVAFFTKQLNLTVEEAQSFWPVYNEYQRKNDELNSKRRQLLSQLGNETHLSEKELTVLADNYIILQTDEAKLASQYHEKFKTVLPIRKVIAYYRVEQKYKRFLLQQFQKNRKTDNN